MSWIDHSIKLDYKAPIALQNLFDEAEEADRIHSPEYSCIAEAIDVFCKGLVSSGYLTEYQWDLTCMKYPV